MKLFKCVRTLLSLVLLGIFLLACSDRGGSSVSQIEKNCQVHSLLVILPLDDVSARHWKHSAEWFSKNLAEAFSILNADSSFEFHIEWVDENTANMDSVGEEILLRDDLAVIGPLYNRDVDIIASYCSKVNKTLIAPMATADSVVRKFSTESWFFDLVESDFSQTDVLLNEVIANYGKTVALLVSNSLYGKTFLDWLEVRISDVNLENLGFFIYNDEKSLDSAAKSAFTKKADYVICVPDSYKSIPRIMEAYKKAGSSSKLLFGNSAYDYNLLKFDEVDGVEGFSVGSNPGSGFESAYQSKYSESTISGEAQFYDALMLSALAQMMAQVNDYSFRNALEDCLKNDDDESVVWDSYSIARTFEKIRNGEPVSIGGVSSNLNFDKKDKSVVIGAIYNHWKIVNGKFVILDYVSLSYVNHVTFSYESLYWLNLGNNLFYDEDVSIEYPELRGNYALLVATSSGWTNYRHQADVLSVYQMLKSNGFDDDHIVLIMEDDLAKNANNPEQGVVKNFNGDDVHKGIVVDYKTSEIDPEDLVKILSGEKSKDLPHVINADSTQNVFVFWSGHGMEGSLNWLDNDYQNSFTYEKMVTLLNEISDKKKYRKLLWLIEACHSGSVCEAFSDAQIPGALCIAAARSYETSKAYMRDPELRTYVTNTFTMNFIRAGMGAPDRALAILYRFLVNNTQGSHVTLFNAENFDNLYSVASKEFIVPYAPDSVLEKIE